MRKRHGAFLRTHYHLGFSAALFSCLTRSALLVHFHQDFRMLSCLHHFLVQENGLVDLRNSLWLQSFWTPLRKIMVFQRQALKQTWHARLESARTAIKDGTVQDCFFNGFVHLLATSYSPAQWWIVSIQENLVGTVSQLRAELPRF